MIVKTDVSFAALDITPPLSPPVVHNCFPHDAALVDGDAAPDELLDVERDGELRGLPQRRDHAHPARLHLLQRELRPRLLPVLLRHPPQPLGLLLQAAVSVDLKPEPIELRVRGAGQVWLLGRLHDVLE